MTSRDVLRDAHWNALCGIIFLSGGAQGEMVEFSI